MHRTIFVTAIACFVLQLCCIAQVQGPAMLPAAAPVVTFRNIKLLKGMKGDQLLATMKEYDKALNVKCDFCHEIKRLANGSLSGYALDAKPMKAKAREMIRMVNSMNNSYKTLDAQATCWMCHHGHPEPEANGM